MAAQPSPVSTGPDVIPIPASWWIGGGVALALSVALGASVLSLNSEKTSHANTKASWAQDRQEAAEKALAQSEVHRLRERALEARKTKEIDRAEALLVQERADRAIADAAAGRLRERLEALIAAARQAASAPDSAAASSPAGDTLGMLADVLGRCVARVRLLATVADERGIAGQTCERSYDSLIEGQAP